MKAFVLKQSDFQQLLDAIDRDPRYGRTGGSSNVLTEDERKAFEEAHSFFNFHVRRWIESVQKD